MKRQRLDTELVRRGICDSAETASKYIADQRVLVNGAIALSADRMVAPNEAVTLREIARFVGRGAEKLEAALEQFGIDVVGKHVVDIGSSTGGFTDCVLQRGARLVTAIDVGTNQLHERLRSDIRVHVYEQTTVRNIDWESVLSEPADLAVIDVSFLSLRSIATEVSALLVPVIALIKPQFEATHAQASKGKGVIRDAEIQRQAIVDVVATWQEAGLWLGGLMPSPITGAQGNREFLAHFTTQSDKTLDDLEKLMAKVVEMAQ